MRRRGLLTSNLRQEKWRADVNTTMDIWVAESAGNLLSSRETARL